MIDLEKAIKEFERYVDKYKIHQKMITHKYKHSYKVMEISMEIAKSLNLSEEEINLAGLIGLLHDIGRFPQWDKYKTFRDAKSVDHADLSVSVLFDKDYIRKYIEEDTYDEIIRKSIGYHNKYKIGECNKTELLFSKIIRDADKLDILNILTLDFQHIRLRNFDISNEVIEQALQKELIDIHNLKTDLDGKIFGISYIFDINFKWSYELLKEKNYVNILFDLVIKNVKDEDSVSKLSELKKEMSNYIEEKINTL